MTTEEQEAQADLYRKYEYEEKFNDEKIVLLRGYKNCLKHHFFFSALAYKSCPLCKVEKFNEENKEEIERRKREHGKN